MSKKVCVPQEKGHTDKHLQLRAVVKGYPALPEETFNNGNRKSNWSLSAKRKHSPQNKDCKCTHK